MGCVVTYKPCDRPVRLYWERVYSLPLLEIRHSPWHALSRPTVPASFKNGGVSCATEEAASEMSLESETWKPGEKREWGKKSGKRFFFLKKNAFCVRHSTSRDYAAQVAVSALHNMYFYVLSQIEYLREHFSLLEKNDFYFPYGTC